jgi:hypothetical protein
MSWSVIARFATLGEAEMARSAVEAAGIDVFLGDENTVSMNWMYSQALGGVKLLVPDEDRDQAAAILASRIEEGPVEGVGSAEAEAAGSPIDSVDDVLRCPACGSADLRPVPRLKLFFFLSIGLYGAAYALGQHDLGVAAIAAVTIIAVFAPSHRCGACGEVSRHSAPRRPAGPAPLPDASDSVEPVCPRCGSLEFYEIDYRQFKAASLLIGSAIILVLAVFPFLPNRKCESCGLRK